MLTPTGVDDDDIHQRWRLRRRQVLYEENSDYTKDSSYAHGVEHIGVSVALFIQSFIQTSGGALRFSRRYSSGTFGTSGESGA